MDLDLLNTLQDYGMTDKEAKIYLSILEMGSSSVGVISRRSGVKRVTIYTVLQEMIKEGIVSETIKNGVKSFSVIDPDRLLSNAEQKYEQFKKLLPKFMSIKEQYGDRPALQFFQGKHNVDQMLYDYTMIRVESIKKYDITRRGFQDHAFVEQYREWLGRYRAKHTPNEKIRLLSNESKIEREIGKDLQKTHNRIIKEIPDGFTFESTIWVLGDYIIIISNRSENHYAYQIHDAVFAKNMREIFRLLRKVN